MKKYLRYPISFISEIVILVEKLALFLVIDTGKPVLVLMVILLFSNNLVIKMVGNER